MGNQLSEESGAKLSSGTFGRRGALGLNKSELDKRCHSSGLYSSCPWDEKAVRRLIGDGRIAARLKGSETTENINNQECPICFLYYAQTNITQCCKAHICTECFLQIKPQKTKHSVCPFCNCTKMGVTIAKKIGAEEIEERELMEQKVIEARIKARVEGKEDMSLSASNTENGEFGSCLHNETVRREKMRTLSESENAEKAGPIDDVQMLRNLSLTSTDRQNIEKEMKAQHSHPLTLKMEAEAEEKRIENEREYNRKNPRRNTSDLLHARLMGGGGALQNRVARINGNRSWIDMMNAFDRVDGHNGDSMDDMVIMEAAILLSMQEEPRSRNNGNNLSVLNPLHRRKESGLAAFVDSSEVRRRFRGRNRIVSLPPMNSNSLASLSRALTEEDQIAMAIALSMQESQGKKAGGEVNKEEKDGSGNDAESCTISSTVASLPEVSSVASLSSKNNSGEDDDDDSEHEIIFSRELTTPKNGNLNVKWSPDDVSYLNMMLDKNEDQKIPIATKLKEG